MLGRSWGCLGAVLGGLGKVFGNLEMVLDGLGAVFGDLGFELEHAELFKNLRHLDQ